jgi:cell wall-associated NlpC family hydrolase
MRRAATLATVLLVAPVAVLGGLFLLVVEALAGVGPSPPTQAAIAELPSSMFFVFEGAATTCEGLPWQVLAALSVTEDPGLGRQLDPTTGEIAPPIVGPPLDGTGGRPAVKDAASADGWAHDEGLYQLTSTTWERWAVVAPGRPDTARPDPQNAWDATYTLARYLCVGTGSTVDVAGAIATFNPDPGFDARVWDTAVAFGMNTDSSTGDGGPGTGPVLAAPPDGQTYPGDGALVVQAAETQIGVPYLWGGVTPGVGLDCSGLVLVAYAAAGISMPRTTYAQATVGVTEPAGAGVDQPGDLLFFEGTDAAGSTSALGHVAIYIGNGLMIQAPYTGTVVQIDPVPWSAVELVRRVVTGP